jgi:hypothetical protein
VRCVGLAYLDAMVWRDGIPSAALRDQSRMFPRVGWKDAWNMATENSVVSRHCWILCALSGERTNVLWRILSMSCCHRGERAEGEREREKDKPRPNGESNTCQQRNVATHRDVCALHIYSSPDTASKRGRSRASSARRSKKAAGRSV